VSHFDAVGALPRNRAVEFLLVRIILVEGFYGLDPVRQGHRVGRRKQPCQIAMRRQTRHGCAVTLPIIGAPGGLVSVQVSRVDDRRDEWVRGIEPRIQKTHVRYVRRRRCETPL
jgi:hypothetical protein